MNPLSDTEKAKLADFFKFLRANQIVNQSTDVHLAEDGIMLNRTRGDVLPAKKWDRLTDDDAKLLPDYTFQELKGLLLGKDTTDVSGLTVVHRGLTTQVRVQGLRTVAGEKLFIRIQPLEPPKLTATLASNVYAPLVKSLSNASGLVLICGPIGSGKTTLAASLVEHWASQSHRPRHIATVEDPVEYFIKPRAGEVSSVSASLLLGERGKGISFTEVLRDLLRSDIDGMFIGEARDSTTRNACLDFAATEEPVVTTVHAGGFSDAILRLTHTEAGQDAMSLHHVLSQCLHSILYVKLAYTSKGIPVPVITALPGHLAAVKGAISEGVAKTMLNRLHQALKGCDANGGADGNAAVASALERGATESSAREALPPEARKMIEG